MYLLQYVNNAFQQKVKCMFSYHVLCIHFSKHMRNIFFLTYVNIWCLIHVFNVGLTHISRMSKCMLHVSLCIKCTTLQHKTPVGPFITTCRSFYYNMIIIVWKCVTLLSENMNYNVAQTVVYHSGHSWTPNQRWDQVPFRSKCLLFRKPHSKWLPAAQQTYTVYA